jgi:hypothetical protein
MELQDGSVPRPLGRGHRATARHTLRCASKASTTVLKMDTLSVYHIKALMCSFESSKKGKII